MAGNRSDEPNNSVLRYMKKLIALPLILTLICCTAARDRKIVNDFFNKEVSKINTDSLYLNRKKVNTQYVLDVYNTALKQKLYEQAPEYYYYTPDTLNVWPFNEKEVAKLMKKAKKEKLKKWKLKNFDCKKFKVMNTLDARDSDIFGKPPYFFTFSKPLVGKDGKTALLFCSSGHYLGSYNKHGVFVLKKVNGTWQEVGVTSKDVY